jgi:hypothetical protein
MFHDRLTLLNIVGFCICQVGIAAYIALRYDPDDRHVPPPLDMNVEEGVNIPLAASMRHGYEEVPGREADGFNDDNW